MTLINEAFINALLADAAYVNVTSIDDLAAKLSTRMTPTLAKFIGDNFTVVTSINTPDGATEGSGFDAVVWRGNAGKPYANQLYVSMRGTEGPSDFINDAQLAVSGNARTQLVDMVNWWLRATTPPGQSGAQVKSVRSNTQDGVWEFEADAPVAGTGAISQTDLALNVQVNGHSLGGYLAATFTRLFGTQAHVAQTTTFNSAGIAPGSEPAFIDIQSVVGPSQGRPAFAEPGDSCQLNYFAVHGLNLTTNTFWFSQVGQRVQLFNEESPTQIANHFMYKLTDSLALTVALKRLDPTLTVERANTILETGSNIDAASNERVLGSLVRLLVNPSAGDLPYADAGSSAAERVTFHNTLRQLQDESQFQALIGKVRIDPSSIDTGAKARSYFSAMASLLALSPVVLTGTDQHNRDHRAANEFAISRAA